MKTILAAAAIAAAIFGHAAGAVTVTVGALPTEATLNPTPTAIGTFAGGPTPAGTLAYYGNVTGHQFVGGTMVARDVWEGTGLAGTGVYGSVSGNSFAQFDFGVLQTGLSFVWGSPDTYNNLVIRLISGGVVTTINGIAAQPPVASGATFITISDVRFDRLVFQSGSNAFEFANLTTTPIPLPAGFVLLLGALAGLGLVARRRAGA